MSDDNTLYNLKLWNQGDDRGLEALVAQHLPWLHDQVRRRMGPLLSSKAETGDYVHDAVIDFMRYVPRFQVRSGDLFRALLLKVVENTLRHKNEWFRARRRDIARERPLPSDTVLSLDPPGARPTSTPSLSAARHEEEAFVRLALEFLDAEYRHVIVLRQWDRLPFERIGEQLGVSANAARMKHRRALRQLAERIWELRSGRLHRLVNESLSGRKP
jgi:RNA polymerase sigma-70 factor (ECF subfamily)